MVENTISTLNEVFKYINEHSDKNLFFRGENRYYKTFCLPPILREKAIKYSSLDSDRGINWFTEKLESLSIKTPYKVCNTNGDNILNTLLNIPPWTWISWGEDKLLALMKHYAFDFIELEKIFNKNDLASFFTSSPSAFLDITSDIIVALHFSCSEFSLFSQNEEKPSETETPSEGYLFVFNLQDIEKAKYLRLVHHSSYAYFYKNGDKIYYQPFDRITHQRGAFLAPKININYEDFQNELKNVYLVEKIKLKINVKQELYKIFGSETGLDYYFPKILPLLSSKDNNILESYKSLKGITLLEKKE